MACAPCQKQRQRVMDNLRRGNAAGTVKALSLGAKMMAEKAAGVDIAAKYMSDDEDEKNARR